MTSPTTVVPVILSGGAGTRLWPLSRAMAPKAFMALPDGETLLAKTAARARALPGVAEILTVTDRELYLHSRDIYAGLAGGRNFDAAWLLEPFGRSTGPAIAFAALAAQARHGDDALLVVLPADHLIADQAAFAAAVSRATDIAKDRRLVTFGIAPTGPETGFGYLECGDALPAAGALPPAFRVRRFVEKPDAASARALIATGTHVWNSGMFCFTAATVLAAFERHAEDLLAAVRHCAGALDLRAGPMLEIDPDLFAAVPDISFDYALMETAAAAGEVAVVRGTFDWSDIGTWQAVAALTPPDAHGNRVQGDHVGIATTETFVRAGDRVVATVGVDNLAIVDTPDALLVAHRDRLQDVRDVVAALDARGHGATRLPRTVVRPWGAFTMLSEGPGFKVQKDRGASRRRDVAAAAPPPQRALGRRRRRRPRHARQPGIRRRRARIRVHRRRREAPYREPRPGSARHCRGAVRRSPRRGRHRPLRRPVRPSQALTAITPGCRDRSAARGARSGP